MQSATDFWVYFNIVVKRLWLIVLLFVVTVGTILAISFTAKPFYRSTVRLQVLPADRSDISLFSTTRTTATIEEIQQAQSDFIRALTSGFVAWKTVADLNLEISAADLLEGLSTAVEGEFIIVTVQSDDPGRAEGIANEQVNNALDYFRSVRGTSSRVLLEFVSELLDSDYEKMAAAEKSLLQFKQRYSFDSIKQETEALQALVRQLRLDRDQARIEQDRADIFAKLYRSEEAKALEKAKELEALEIAPAATPKPAATQTKEAQASAGAPYTRRYYHDLAMQHQATALNYEARRDGYARQVAIQDEMIQARITELDKMLKLYSEYNTLEREFTRALNNYDFLRDKQNEARLKQSQAQRMGYIQISEPARKPDAPVASKTLQLAAVGGAVSILVGFFLSFLIEFLNSLGQVAKQQRLREQGR